MDWLSEDFFVTFQGLILKVVTYEKDDGVGYNVGRLFSGGVR